MRIVGYRPEVIFDVVGDVAQYNRFVPWCQESKIIRQYSSHEFDAELSVGFNMFKERYTSHVTLYPYEKVTSHVGDSSLLFTHLDSTWVFQPGPSPESCLIKFHVDFGFKSQLYRSVANMFFDEVVRHMMGSFEQRCHQLHGASSFKRRDHSVKFASVTH